MARRLLAGLIDVGVPLVGCAFMWLVAVQVVASLSLALFLGLHGVLLFPVLVLIGWVGGVVLNDLALPQTRGWSLGMLVTRLRVSPTPPRAWRLLLRTVVTWGSIVAVYLGAEVVRFELRSALDASLGRSDWPWLDTKLLAAAVVLVWVVVLSFPLEGRTLLDRVAGWQVRDRATALSAEPSRGRRGIPLWGWGVVVLAGSAGALFLAVAAIALVLAQQPGRTQQVETDLRNAATALEAYHAEHGRYDDAALDPYWGYGRGTDVRIEAHIPADGQSFCLEGFHVHSTARISTYDSDSGLDRDATC